MASVREISTKSARLYKLCHSTYTHNAQRFGGANCSLSYDNKEFSTQNASDYSFTPVMRDRNPPPWQTAEEKLQILEQKVKQLVAKNNQMIASIDKETLSLDCISSLTMWLSLVPINRNVSGRELTTPMEDKQLLTENHKPLQDVTSSAEAKRAALFQLRERNGELAQKIKEVEQEKETLKEKQLLDENQLDCLLGTRLEIKSNNIKLRKKNTKMLKTQRKLTSEQIQMMKELDGQERELTAALKTNQNSDMWQRDTRE